MAIEKTYVGNVIVSQYNTLDTYADNGVVVKGLRLEGQGRVEGTPVDPYDILRYMDIGVLVQSVNQVGTSSSGLFSARPVTGGPGDYYYAYDTGVMYSWNGSAWVQVATWNGIITGTLAGRPAAEFYGRYYWAGDVNYLFFDNSNEWITVNGIGFGTLANRPAVTTNVFYFATDTDALYFSDGVTWEQIGGSSFSGSVDIAEALSVGQTADITGDLTVGGSTNLGSDTSVGSTLTVTQPNPPQSVLVLKSTTTGGDPIITLYQDRVETTGATATTIVNVGTVSNSTILIDAVVIGRRTGGVSGAAGDTDALRLHGLFKNVAGTVTQVGSTVQVFSADGDYTVDFTISGTGVLVRGTGAATTTITWHAHVTTYLVTT